MDAEEIVERIKENDSPRIKIAVADIDGVLRGKYIHKEKFFSGLDSGLGFCDVIFGWDSGDRAYDNSKVTGWHTGYPDAQFRIDLSTYRTIPWENDTPFFLADFSREGGAIQKVCPRTLLKKIQQQSIDLGFYPYFTQEFEWFNFKETSHQLEEKGFHNPTPLTTGMFGYSVHRMAQQNSYVSDLFHLLDQFDVSLEGLHTETGPGVYEACTHPNLIVRAADQAALLKAGVKEIANKHEIMACFMAKWSAAYPGCSGHIHQSLWDVDKNRNLFFNANESGGISDKMRSYIAGQLKCLPYIMPMYAPTVNSYKRLVEGAWAPTTITWGFDNRTTALRVLTVNDKLTRLETRIPGADTNPYLAMAASLASGLYGIKNNLSLDIEATKGNGYDNASHGRLAKNLHDATNLMKTSSIPGELFGEEFVDHFIRTREWEWRQFADVVTDWELKRYFEII